jgi:hypothetical protein
MAAVKDVLRHVSTEVAGRQRKCYRRPADHLIVKGQPCLVVRDASRQKRTYCTVCAHEILARARERLDELAEAVSQ